MPAATTTKPQAPVTLEQQNKQFLSLFRAGDHFTIQIPKVDRGARNSFDPVYIGINGVGYAIKRGANVVVPAAVIEVLRNACETTYEQRGEGRNAEMVATEVLSYGYQILAGPHGRDESPVPGAVVAGSAARAAA